MKLQDNRKFPFYEEMQLRVDVAKLDFDEEFVIDNHIFKIPGDLLEKLGHFKVTNPAKVSQLKNCLKSKRVAPDKVDDFWEINAIEQEILEYYVDIVQTQDVLEKLNDEYQDVFLPARLAKALNLNAEQVPYIYYSKEGSDILPDDRLGIYFPNTDAKGLRSISDRIGDPYDYQCICVVHRGHLEIYGIFKVIAQHLQGLKKSG